MVDEEGGSAVRRQSNGYSVTRQRVPKPYGDDGGKRGRSVERLKPSIHASRIDKRHGSDAPQLMRNRLQSVAWLALQ